MATTLTYFKRYRMEIDLTDLPPRQPLPLGYRWRGWHLTTPEDHAIVKCLAFRDSIDAVVFSNLSCLDGCLQLMGTIRNNPGFCPDATWLVEGPDGPCGTVQGVIEGGVGSIQNVGVLPGLRGMGLGTMLVLKALEAFRDRNLYRGALDVTARNASALKLYRRLGFYVRRTLYREVETEQAEDDFVI
jgi:ribosomal protein S18 acetylase RimI-like enzyme